MSSFQNREVDLLMDCCWFDVVDVSSLVGVKRQWLQRLMEIISRFVNGGGVWTINCSTVHNNTFSGENSANTLPLLSKKKWLKIIEIPLFPFYDWKFCDFCWEKRKGKFNYKCFAPSIDTDIFSIRFFLFFLRKYKFSQSQDKKNWISHSIIIIHEHSMCCFSPDGDLIWLLWTIAVFPGNCDIVLSLAWLCKKRMNRMCHELTILLQQSHHPVCWKCTMWSKNFQWLWPERII